MSRTYLDAAKVLNKFRNKRGGIKSLAFGTQVGKKKVVFALVCETVKYHDAIETLMKAVGLDKDTVLQDKDLLKIMLYDLMFGKGKIDGGGKVKRTLMSYKDRLTQALVRLKARKGAKANSDLLPEDQRLKTSRFPRYARINTLRMSSEQFDKLVADGALGDVEKDSHIPNVVAFPSGSDLHEHELVKSGKLILQDKASCFSAHALQPKPGWTVMDACAAPGNKTSHAAALMNGQGVVHAFEINKKRGELLARRMKQAGADNVRVHVQSFLDVDFTSAEYKQVQAILVDPTCSGSGMVDRLDNLGRTSNSEEVEQKRVDGLAEFQEQIILHAMKAPVVQRVVYSTCSVHARENEHVVTNVLSQRPDFRLEKALPDWPRRGLPNYACGEYCVRTDPAQDQTNGFFVACFVKQATAKVRKRKAQKAKRKRQDKRPKTSQSSTESEGVGNAKANAARASTSKH